MIRPSAQAAAKAAKNPRAAKLAAAAGAAILALAGCKGLPTAGAGASGGGGSGGGAAPAAAPAQSGALITEPQAGFSRVYHLIKQARHSIDLTMYEFSDTKAEHDLAAAAKRGVTVKVVLDQREKSHNSAAFDYLKSHGVKVVWSSPRFEYTHQKTLLADRSTAVIMTANLTSEYYSSTRDFLVLDTKAADVAAIAQVFNADFAHRSVQPGDGKDLVWSPTDSQAKLLALIGGATKSLRIYSEEMGDTTIEDALIKAAKRGVTVKVCGENESGEYDWRKTNPRFTRENFQRNLTIVGEVQAVAAEARRRPGADHPSLAARPGQRHRPDPRHPAGRPRRGEHRPPTPSN